MTAMLVTTLCWWFYDDQPTSVTNIDVTTESWSCWTKPILSFAKFTWSTVRWSVAKFIRIPKTFRTSDCNFYLMVLRSQSASISFPVDQSDQTVWFYECQIVKKTRAVFISSIIRYAVVQNKKRVWFLKSTKTIRDLY